MKSKSSKTRKRSRIPFVILVPLALLGIPRVVVHDLHLVDINSLLYTFLAFLPFLVWSLYAFVFNMADPFRNLFILGLLFGIFLAITHMLTWDASWGGNQPHIGGNLAGKFDPATESLMLKTATVLSSVFTGLFAGGALCILRLGRHVLRQTTWFMR